jgi:hypothetical protein
MYIFLIVVLGWGTLWHLQKFSQYIKCDVDFFTHLFGAYFSIHSNRTVALLIPSFLFCPTFSLHYQCNHHMRDQ